MDVHLDNPQLKAQIDLWVAKTGRRADELVEDAIAGYFDELARLRGMLDGRYDDIKSGRVALIDGDDAYARLQKKNEDHRRHTA